MAQITDTKIFTNNNYLIFKTFNTPSCMIDLSCQKHVEINTSESIDKSLMINGKSCRIIGSITMDSLIVDITDVDAKNLKVGSYLELIKYINAKLSSIDNLLGTNFNACSKFFSAKE